MTVDGMLMSPEASVHAEIERRLELAGRYRRYEPVRPHRTWPHLRDLLRRRLRSPRPPAPLPMTAAGRHHLPIPFPS